MAKESKIRWMRTIGCIFSILTEQRFSINIEKLLDAPVL
jgi:hypothetical protein